MAALPEPRPGFLDIVTAVPRQGDLVEVLPDLPCQHTQFVQFVRSAQKLLVVSSCAVMRAVLIGNIAAHLAVMFDGSPDTDMHGGEHRFFGDHCKTSR